MLFLKSSTLNDSDEVYLDSVVNTPGKSPAINSVWQIASIAGDNF